MVSDRGAAAHTGRLIGKLRRAVHRWDMLEEGEAVAIGVSGGHDSLALLCLLVAHNKALRVPHPLHGLHVRLTADGTEPLPAVTASWCRSLGVEIEDVAARLDPTETLPLECYRCARVRRRTLLETADARGCRVVALGHHADDVVETFLLGLLYTGRSDVLAPKREYFSGAVRLIRPLYEIRRAEIRRLAARWGFPPPPPTCLREEEDSDRRGRVQRMLRTLGHDEDRVRRQLFWATVHQLDGTSVEVARRAGEPFRATPGAT